MKILLEYWPIVIAVLAAVWWAARIDTKVRGFDGKFQAIDGRFQTIEALLNTIIGSIGEKRVAESKSPVQLNEYGKTIAEKLGGSKFIRAHLEYPKIHADMNEYQIQQACFAYAQNKLMDRLSREDRDKLESIAFSEGLPIQTIMRVVGIEVRNAKLKELGRETAAINSP